jgi:UDP-N-acetylmuramoyl-tripeptide--D-alanyl-D-alanine ligase
VLDLTVREAATAMRATVSGPLPDSPALAGSMPGISIDTRTIRPGEAFCAIRGDRFDGHDFAGKAFRAGASILVVDHPVPAPPEVPQLIVQDTTSAIQQLARFARRKWGKELVAITGSMGKTTTREFTAALLQARYSVLQSQGNLNNHLGLPLTLLNLRNDHEMAVVELGMNHAGEIDFLGSICLPTAVLLTNVAPVHLEFFESVEAIAQAKGEILNHLPASGRLFFNGDDERLSQLARRHVGQTHSFGFEATNDYRIGEWSIDDLDSMPLSIAGPDLILRSRLQCVGKHFLYNLIGAVAVAHSFGLGKEELAVSIPRLKALRGRGQIQAAGKLFVWDDSYNSNPAAVATLLQTLQSIRGVKRIVLVLGTMLELGPESARYHYELGAKIPVGVSKLVTVGSLAEEIGRGAVEGGFPTAAHRHCTTAEEAATVIGHIVDDGDLVVVKGSRGVGLDRVVASLQGDPA